MSDYLPALVLADILSRLPVKTLLRFRCVCKSWLILFSSPHFIATHLNHSTNNNARLLLRHFSLTAKKEHYSLRLATDEPLLEEQQLKCPFKTRSANFFRVIGCCNGLICLSDDRFSYTYTIIIWNPAIRRFVSLPRPMVCFDSYGPYMLVLGFGFDSVTNDHKVVRICYLQGRDNAEGYVVPPEVEVYSVQTGSWKTVVSAASVEYSMVEYFWSSAFVNGAVHWIVYKRDEQGLFCNKILVFDMSNEVFREMEVPQQLVHMYPLDLSIAVCGDTVSVIWYRGRSRWKLCDRCAVWVMNKYGDVGSWTEKFFVDVEGGISMALGFGKNGDLLLENCAGYLVSYCPAKCEIKNLGIHGGKDSFYVDAYAESLVLLNGGLGQQLKSCDAVDDSEEKSETVDNFKEYELIKHSVLHFMFSECFMNN